MPPGPGRSLGPDGDTLGVRPVPRGVYTQREGMVAWPEVILTLAQAPFG